MSEEAETGLPAAQPGENDPIWPEDVERCPHVVLRDISRILLTDITPHAMLRRIPEEVLRLKRGLCGVAILVMDGERLICSGAAGSAIPFAIGQHVDIADGHLSKAALGERPTELSGFFPSTTGNDDGVRGASRGLAMAFPVRDERNLLGLIIAVSEERELFLDQFMELFELIATLAALAILMTRQRIEIQRHAVEHQAMRKIHGALGETLDQDSILQLIARSAVEMIPSAEGAVIHMLDEGKQALQPVAVAGKVGRGRHAPSMKPGEGVAGQVMAAKTVMNLGDVHKEGRLAKGDFSPETHSLLVGPVSSGGNCFGTISVQSNATNAFSSTDERLLFNLGIEAAIAIHNTKLYHAERHERQMAEALAEAAKSFNLSLDLDQVLDRILEQIVLVIPCRTVNVFLIEGETARIVRHKVYSEDGFRLEYNTDLDFPLTLHSFQFMLETGQPILVTDVSKDEFWHPMPGREWIHSYAAAPLIAGQQTIGFLTVDSEKPHFFNVDTTKALQAFAAHAAIAIHNARLYQNLAVVLQEEKTIRAQLVQADKLAAMGRITSSIAHEVNNPIQAIQGCLDRAQAYVADAEKQKRYLNMAAEELNRLTAILQRVLDFQRPAESERKNVEIHALIEDVLALCEKRLQLGRVKVKLEAASRPVAVKVVSGQLKQVFLNLILNAVDAMPNGGDLIIGTRRVKNRRLWLEIYFQDSGIGMAEDEITRLFEPFYTTKPKGNGLGLWVSSIIVNSHGGELKAHSMPGKGSTFTVLLPLEGRQRSSLKQ